MPLRSSRPGISVGFHAYPTTSDAGTLGDPETILWSSIRHLCSRDVAEGAATKIHGIKVRSDLRVVARNLKIYVQQAYDFYEAARIAKPNTAPLIYYYSFLNLAKAFCEIRKPRFHERNESGRHGISWRPSSKYLVNLEKEHVALTSRGVWHTLWESLMQTTCPAANPTRLQIKQLFRYCPEISTEVGMAFGADSLLVDMVEPDVLYDEDALEAWIRFSVIRNDLNSHRISAPTLIAAITTPRSGFVEVRLPNRGLRSFESAIPANFKRGANVLRTLQQDVLGMNIFSHLGRNKQIEYCLPLQDRLPIRLPQIMVLYTILFWLGSLVRYDPHSVADLTESRYWTLLDGFMSQSRLWLLEQFEWAFYQAETTLWSMR